MGNSLLEKLACSFCSDFLKIPMMKNHKNIKQEEKTNQRIIGLYGAETNILILLKNYMTEYFAERCEKVDILLEKTGYEIDVEYFLEKGDKN